MSSKRAPLIILSGPSGVGKSTVVLELLARKSHPLRRGITATTRSPRQGEVEGIDYHFWTTERFQRALDDNEMLEHAIVHGRDYYGTPRSEVDPYRSRGIGVILVIDVQGAAQIRSLYPQDHLSVFLSVPTADVLRERLTMRGTEDEARMNCRLETASAEWKRSVEFDRIIMNLDLQQAVRDLELIIGEQFDSSGEAGNAR